MKKILFTVYMLLLFIFSAIAHPTQTQVRSNTQVVVAKKVDRTAVNRKKERVIRHRRLHRREARVERRIERRVHHRAHQRHIYRHH